MESRCKAGSVLVGWMLAVMIASPALAASFDCDRAESATEKAICGNGQLSNLDSKLGSYYDEALRTVQDAQALKQEQRDWLSERDRCEGDEDCITARYEERIAALIERLPQASAGPRYRLMEEEYSPFLPESQHGLCNAVVDTLNRMQPVRPMTCGFEVPPGLEPIETPQWDPLDPAEHRQILREIARMLAKYLPDAEEYRAEIEQNIESGKVRMWEARFDLNNEPGYETVLLHDLWGCEWNSRIARDGVRPFGLAVPEEGGSGMLHKGYWRLHERPSRMPFVYKGRTWLWKWWGVDELGEEAGVYQTAYARDEFGWHRTPTCEIEYVE